MPGLKKLFNKHLPILLLLLAQAWTFQHRHIADFPSGIHAWAQTDRYALALGFIRNGFDFFHPETYVLNHQFPDDWLTDNGSSITAVDFPAHDFVAALMMKFSGNHSIFVFRLYVLLISLLGLFLLYRSAWLICGSFFKSALVLLFAATSPVFVFYQSSTLPTITALSFAITGIWFFLQFRLTLKNSHFTLALLFLTLAALTRTTMVIWLAAVAAVSFWPSKKQTGNLSVKLMVMAFSFSIIAGYWMYNRHLSGQYGSMFLNEILWLKGYDQFIDCMQVIWQNWKNQWLSAYHYAGLTAVLLLYLLQRKERFNTHYDAAPVRLIRFSFAGFVIFFFVMLRQFPHHDYYFLDTFFLPVVMAFAFMLSRIRLPQNFYFRAILIAVAGFLFTGSAVYAFRNQQERYAHGTDQNFRMHIRNFENASAFLDSLLVPADARILAVHVPAPNTPFIFMNRKGYVVLSSNIFRERHIKAIRKFDFDYLVFENAKSEEVRHYLFPDLSERFDLISGNTRLQVWKKAAVVI